MENRVLLGHVRYSRDRATLPPSVTRETSEYPMVAVPLTEIIEVIEVRVVSTRHTSDTWKLDIISSDVSSNVNQSYDNKTNYKTKLTL